MKTAKLTIGLALAVGFGLADVSTAERLDRDPTSPRDSDLFATSYNDVPPSHPYYSYITDLSDLGITGGCSVNPPLYCPDANVQRGSMAVLLMRMYKLITVGATNGPLLPQPAVRGESGPGAINLIGGDASNAVAAGAGGATIAGGGEAGGGANRVEDGFGTVGGGRANTAGSPDGTPTNAGFATVAGGEQNRASGPWSSVGGGNSNTANGRTSSVGGGDSNQAYGASATVPGGEGNLALGDWSFAAGRAAEALHAGSFVWGDSTTPRAYSTAPNQFIVRASGGVGINTASPNATLTVAGGLSLLETGPQAPTPDYGKIYARPDRLLYYLDSAGVEYDLTRGGPTGPVGATGPQGTTGAIGPQGPSGARGTGERAGFSRTTIDSVGDVGRHTSIAIGVDALAQISFYDATLGALKIAHCADTGCTSAQVLLLDDSGDVGQYSSITMAADGFPLVSYYDAGAGDLKVLHCTDIACFGGSIFTIDSAGDVGRYTSMALGADGLGIVSYQGVSEGLKVAHCDNLACSTATVSVVDSTAAAGAFSSIAIGADGLPFIAYQDGTGLNLRTAHCTDVACTGATLATPDATGDVGQYASVAISSDGLPVVSYYDATGENLKFLHCSNLNCNAAIGNVVVTLDSGGSVGSHTSVAIGSDGFPVIAYHDATNLTLKVAHCQNAACGSLLGASAQTNAWDVGGHGQFSSIARGQDGFPIVSYFDGTGSDLKVAHGSNALAIPWYRPR